MESKTSRLPMIVAQLVEQGMVNVNGIWVTGTLNRKQTKFGILKVLGREMGFTINLRPLSSTPPPPPPP